MNYRHKMHEDKNKREGTGKVRKRRKQVKPDGGTEANGEEYKGKKEVLRQYRREEL